MTTTPVRTSARVQRAAPPGSLRRRSPRSAATRWGLLLAAPATLHTLLWIGIPIIVAIILSFTSYDVITRAEFTGLDNYVVLFGDSLFWRSILHNVIIAAIGIPV